MTFAMGAESITILLSLVIIVVIVCRLAAEDNGKLDSETVLSVCSELVLFSWKFAVD